ncbi:hypothetical protein EYV94_05250 [Puteibacter caeruleilacunae]|nr:hypothetical protein EYV94_05250 [Puteibacter caeruleilacunae]
MRYSFPYRISAVYVVAGFLWILFSDKAIHLIASDQEVLTQLQTYKGWFFILITGIILFFYTLREFRQRDRLTNELIDAKNRAVEADQLKTAFLANMSHEIRTPMNSILGFADLITQEGYSEEEKDRFKDIINEKGNELLHLINDIIDIAQIQEGQVKINPVAINITDLINEVYNSFKKHPLVKGKPHILFSKHIPHYKESLFVTADAYRLKQVFHNLLSNAFKYSDEGEVKFGFKQDHNQICFFVKDTGIGIPINIQHLIFERFNQKKYLHGKPEGGTGLGLPISKSIVELMGGELKFTTEEGHGSEFFFCMPLHQ